MKPEIDSDEAEERAQEIMLCAKERNGYQILEAFHDVALQLAKIELEERWKAEYR